MGMYLDVFKFYFSRYFAYPLEILGSVFRRFFEIILVILFWLTISRTTTKHVDMREISSYFLIAGAVNEFVMAQTLTFAMKLSDTIMRGELNNYLIKPVRIIPYLYFSTLGRLGLNILLGTVSFIAGIILMPPKSFAAFGLFIAYLVCALFISLGFNIIGGSITFAVTDSMGIRTTIQHIIRLLSGLLVPISFFPSHIRSIVMLSPFPSMVFGPSNALHQAGIDSASLMSLSIAAMWAVIMPILGILVWRHYIKRYEAIGI